MGPVQLGLVRSAPSAERFATPQAPDKPGLKSPCPHPGAFPAWSWAAGLAAGDGANPPADSARQQTVLTGRLQRACAGLFARLPHADAIALASLAAAGQVRWPEIHAALDAMLKRATLAALDGERLEESSGRSASERAIWARYDAACARLFAEESELAASKRQAHEALLDRERKLDILRIARDTALAELAHALAAPSPPAANAAHASPDEEAVDTLRAAGFTASEQLAQLIAGLAREIVSGSTTRAERIRSSVRLVLSHEPRLGY